MSRMAGGPGADVPAPIIEGKAGGFWAWLQNLDPVGRPQCPTLVRIKALVPDPAAPPGSAQVLAVVEVELDPCAAELDLTTPSSTGAHLVLTVSIVQSMKSASVDPGKFRHHWKSTSALSGQCASISVPGLKPDTLYAFDASVANTKGSSEAVSIHVLTPSPDGNHTFSCLPPTVEDVVTESLGALVLEDDELIFYDAEEEEAWQECDPYPGDGDESAGIGKGDALARSFHGSPGAPKLPPGFIWAAGFLIHEWQITNDEKRGQIDKIVEQVEAACHKLSPIKHQQALRLALGAGLNPNHAVIKWRNIMEWRRTFSMEDEQHRARDMQRSGNRSAPVSFPHHDEVCGKLLRVSPCAMVTTNGYPLTIWHVGTMNPDGAAHVSHDDLMEWSRSMFEYLDVWLLDESDRTGRLMGHVHVFDLQGLSWRHLMSGALFEKGKAALHAGEFYVERCYAVYAINANTLFHTVWKFVQKFLSARAASKIIVDSNVPEDLLNAIGPQGTQRLHAVLEAPSLDKFSPVLRPPRRGGRSALL